MSFQLFADENYELPADLSDIFLKLPKSGQGIKVLIVGQVVTGFSYWDSDKRPHRSPTPFKATPDIKRDESGKPETPKHFWILPVFDFESNTFKLLEITQKSIQGLIFGLIKSGDYNLTNFKVGLRITANGTGLNTKYSVMPTPITGFDESSIDHPIYLGGVDAIKEIMFKDVSQSEEDLEAAVNNLTPEQKEKLEAEIAF